MPQHRDTRYRARRRTSAQRRLGHLRTNYTEDDIEAFAADLERLRSVWPESVREDDDKAYRRQVFKTNSIICAAVMVPLTAVFVYLVIESDISWWSIPIMQTFLLLILWLRLLTFSGSDATFFIYREADRRGVRYTKGDTPTYHIMNRINADYNNHLWNRKFNWT